MKPFEEVAKDIIVWLVKDTDSFESEGVYRTLSDKIAKALQAAEKRGLERAANLMYEWLPKHLGLNHKAAAAIRKEMEK